MIVGAAKSGTTALFYAIQNTLQKRHGLSTQGLFEPTQTRQVKDYLSSGVDRVPLIKMLMGPFIRREMQSVDVFEKKIVIYRDPRDNVISRLVFMLTKLIELSEHDKIEAVMQVLRRKEQDPESLSVVEILKQISQISGRENLLESVRNNAILPAKMKREANGEYFMLPYEDFVAGEFAAMNGYLGFEVDPSFEVGERHTYVVRTKAAGSWKDWFLDEDVRYFVDEVADDYRELGFDIEQRPHSSKTIDPKTCSEYAFAQFERLREKRSKRKDSRQAKEGDKGAATKPVSQADRKAKRQKRKQRRQSRKGDGSKGSP